jgi:molybdate transport system substrate-binding protein
MSHKFLCGVLMLIMAVSLSANSGSSTQHQKEIIVSAAPSLKNAFTEIGVLFEKQTGTRVLFNFAASGLLEKQIEAGAPVDVYASASRKQMDSLQTQGMILKETRRDFAGNSLILIVPVDSKLRLRTFADISRTDIARLAIGNPKTVPAGQYAMEALIHLKLWDKLRPRCVLAENVRQVMDYVVRGEVDAGLVYASDASIASGKTTIIGRAPEDSHSSIVYPMAVVRGSETRANSQRFIDLTLSKTGQAILQKYGFRGVR